MDNAEPSFLPERPENQDNDFGEWSHLLPVFAETFKAQLLVTDNPEHPLFHGSWDWHSS